MTGDHQRRTPSGHTLRLVPGEEPQEHVGPVDADGRSEATLIVPGERQSVALGRHWVVRTAAGRGVGGMANQVLELLSSELLSNAVLHGSPGGAIGLLVRHGGGVIRVAVSDASAHSPVVLSADPHSLGGRGMAIVEAMSSRWGIENHDGGGKTVWFELDLSDF